MDSNNLRDVKRMTGAEDTRAAQTGAPEAKLELLSDYSGMRGEVIRDPYYGRVEDFETVFEQCSRACKGFLDHVTCKTEK